MRADSENIISPEDAKKTFHYDELDGKIYRKRKYGLLGGSIDKRQIEFDGRAISVKKVAWVMANGEFPFDPVYCLDGNDKNLSKENLFKAITVSSEDGLQKNQDQIRRILNYCKNSGKFTWAGNFARQRKGLTAGWVHSAGYVAITLFGFNVYAHRLAFLMENGEFPKQVVDHINGVRSDNRWENLRAVDQKTNVENRTSPYSKHGKSGLLGVHWCEQRNQWHSEIKTHGERKHIGFFSDKHEAHEAYIKAKREIHKGCTL